MGVSVYVCGCVYECVYSQKITKIDKAIINIHVKIYVSLIKEVQINQTVIINVIICVCSVHDSIQSSGSLLARMQVKNIK